LLNFVSQATHLDNDELHYQLAINKGTSAQIKKKQSSNKMKSFVMGLFNDDK